MICFGEPDWPTASNLSSWVCSHQKSVAHRNDLPTDRLNNWSVERHPEYPLWLRTTHPERPIVGRAFSDGPVLVGNLTSRAVSLQPVSLWRFR